MEVTGDPFSLTFGEFSHALRADSILKVRLKVVGGTEVRLELCCMVSLLGRGRVLGRGTFAFVPYSADDTEIMVPISVDISETALVSFVVEGSVLLMVAELGFSCPSGSPCWASFTFLFFNERSFPIGPGLCSLFSTGLKSGSFWALIGPARGCFWRCSFGSGILSDFSESTGTTSFSFPFEAGAPN